MRRGMRLMMTPTLRVIPKKSPNTSQFAWVCITPSVAAGVAVAVACARTDNVSMRPPGKLLSGRGVRLLVHYITKSTACKGYARRTKYERPRTIDEEKREL